MLRLRGAVLALTMTALGASAAWAEPQPSPEAAALANQAVQAIQAGDNPRGATLAGQSIALQDTVNARYLRGLALANGQNYALAITDFEKAKSMAVAGHADAGTLSTVDAALATSYMMGGRASEGLTLAKAVRANDPSKNMDDAIATYYDSVAMKAVEAGDRGAAVATLEKGAADAPTHGAVMLVEAANVLGGATPPDWPRVEAEARKALAVNANEPKAYYIGAIARANQGDKDGAVKWLNEAKKGAGADKQFNADIDASLKQLGAQ